MNEQLILKYQDDIQNFVNDKYCLGEKEYNFDYFYEFSIDLKKLEFHYKNGHFCKIIKYKWDGEGKWSYISNITIRFNDGETMEHVSGYYLFLTEKSLEKYGWYFKEDDY